jgi:hypothetical protein
MEEPIEEDVDRAVGGDGVARRRAGPDDVDEGPYLEAAVVLMTLVAGRGDDAGDDDDPRGD